MNSQPCSRCGSYDTAPSGLDDIQQELAGVHMTLRCQSCGALVSTAPLREEVAPAIQLMWERARLEDECNEAYFEFELGWTNGDGLIDWRVVKGVGVEPHDGCKRRLEEAGLRFDVPNQQLIDLASSKAIWEKGESSYAAMDEIGFIPWHELRK